MEPRRVYRCSCYCNIFTSVDGCRYGDVTIQGGYASGISEEWVEVSVGEGDSALRGIGAGSGDVVDLDVAECQEGSEVGVREGLCPRACLTALLSFDR